MTSDGAVTFDDELEKRLAQAPVITVPTVTLEGDVNDAPHPPSSSYAKRLADPYAYRDVKGCIGHNLPQEAPEAFAQSIKDVDRYWPGNSRDSVPHTRLRHFARSTR
jgi:pimeloyl-ACP methyl ester carboxylesterase